MNCPREYTGDEVASLVQQWLDVFAPERQGINTKAYMWHVFSGSRYPALEGELARVEYLKQICGEFVILSNDREVAFLTDTRPEDRPFSDFYVFPPNLAWTMAFTHEEGSLGPYFAQHPRYAELNPANIARVKKQEEMAHARSQGWIKTP
ncbi:DUF4275 family protein [Brevifollis gellanilyticus]|uniref:DUF4275 domain-containing protein n=1 Tax=Brevifollis gellanilyticus TaxID=748831 RepID=A0A512MDY9_9BACT|nr:DUF4275 family protein [Brevifollis gellanilyticus]GEP44918.1 hypothetical protein BGE01nite_42090 [Brevifollis gellanilyticus]